MTTDAVARARGRVGKPAALLEVRSLSKRFGEVQANWDVDLTVLPGTVHGLIGENGAGKSTLLKMIYGVYTPGRGTHVRRRGPRRTGQPRRRAGARHRHGVPGPAAGAGADGRGEHRPRAARRRRRCAWPGLAARITEASEAYGLAVDPTAKVRHLSIGERQRAEILKVLMTGARLVILDEPTSVLAPQEVEALFGVVAQLRDQGLGVVLVTHKLGEVRAIADQVTVLRGGQVILNAEDPGNFSDAELVEAMVGRRVPPLAVERVAVPPRERAVLELQGATALGDRGHVALKGVDLEVHPGELVGVAGVAGSGQKELCEVALGLRPVDVGHRPRRVESALPRR